MTGSPEIRFFKDAVGNSVAYSIHGDGPLVVCPTWWVSHVEKDWGHAPVREFFEQLGKDLRIVRYDRPGVGLSDRPGRGGGTLEAEVTLLSSLVDELGADRLSLFAVSCGGPPALAFAAQQPAMIDKLCLYGTYANGNDLASTEIRQAMLAIVGAHWGLGSRAMTDIFMPDASRDVADLMTTYQRDAADPATAVKLLRMIYEMDVTPVLADVAAECLVLHRRGDRAMPHEAGRKLAAGLKNARLMSFDGNAHPPWLDGDEIARAANAFLRGHELKHERTSPTAGPKLCRLDHDNRCLVLSGDRVDLTPLEFALMVEFTRAPNLVLTRDDLLERVWKQPYEGSNRIDSLVSGLRRKLGHFAPSIETVIGHGYRFSGWKRRAVAESAGSKHR